jgi:hypothetical protein
MRLHPHPRRPSIPAAIISFLVTFAAPVLGAESVVVPNIMATADSQFGSGILKASNYHAQAVYSAANFPEDIGLVITELRFRPDYFHGRAFTTTVQNIQFNLSTTTRNPESLSSTFANNVGPDDTVVFNGPLTISSQFIGPATGPKDFDIIIPLTTPFLYNPAAGHLLVDLRNYSGSSEASALSGRGGNDGGSRNGGSIFSPGGAPDTAVEALQVIYTPTNQPPPPPPPSARLVRGPYLQNATTTNIVLRWRTSSPTNSVVQFGLTHTALTWAITNLALTSNHTVVLTNLSPDTRYFYVIGATDTNWAGGSNHFFQTLTATNRPIRIWAMGDFGTTGIYGDGALPVRDAYYNFSANRYTDVWLMLGDNAYGEGTDEQYQRAVFDVYQNILRQTVAWSTIGNHETYGSNLLTGHIAYYDIFNHPTVGEAGGVPSGTTKYYSFNYGNVHFVCLDSEFSEQTDDGVMATWLREDLMANSNLWIIAYFHSPPYTKGSHNSDNDEDTTGHLKNMREIFVPILESFGTDLVLCGHSHIYERSYLIRGHYGYSTSFDDDMKVDGGDGRPTGDGAYVKTGNEEEPAEGTVYVVAGSGGFATAQQGVHPAMFSTILQTGSLVLDVDGNRLDARFLRGTGAIDDTFTIFKEIGPARPKIERIEVSGGTVTLHFRSVVGLQYRVEHATELGPGNWQPISGIITAEELTTPWNGPAPTTGNHFYRIALVTP